MSKKRKSQALEAIYLEIRNRITLLDYMPGDKLSEVVLAEEFGLSRTPIRSILNRLEAEGLVDIRQGVGNFVTAIDIDSMQQVYKLRQELALLFSKLGSAPVSVDLIKQLQQHATELSQLTPCAESKRRFAYLNQQVFEMIHSLVDNQPFREISTHLFYQTTRVWIAWMPDERLADEAKAFANEIDELTRALEMNDIDTLSHLYRCHIAFGFQRLSEYQHQAEQSR